MGEKKIIIGTDFGEYSDLAIRLGFYWGEKLSLRPLVAHVYHRLEFLSGDLFGRFRHDLHNSAEVKLNTQLTRLSLDTSAIEQKIVQGDTAKSLLRLVDEEHPEYMVIGHKGHNLFEEILLGDTTSKLLQQSSTNVLAVKNDKAFNPKKIFIPIIFEKNTDRVVEQIIKLGKVFKAEVMLMHLLEPVYDDYYSMVLNYDPTVENGDQVKKDDNKKMAEEKLTKIKEVIEEQGITCTVKTKYSQESDFVDKLLEQAKRFDADLILMGTHKKKGLKRFIMGSVAEPLVHHAHCSILHVRV